MLRYNDLQINWLENNKPSLKLILFKNLRPCWKAKNIEQQLLCKEGCMITKFAQNIAFVAALPPATMQKRVETQK